MIKYLLIWNKGKKVLMLLMLNYHSLKYIRILNLVPRNAGFFYTSFKSER